MTWTCVRCRRAIDAVLDVCWACGTSRDGVVDPSFAPVEDVPSDGGPTIAELPLPPSLPPPLPARAAAEDDPTAADPRSGAGSGTAADDGADDGADARRRAAASRTDGAVPLRCERCHGDLGYRGERLLLAPDASDDGDDRVAVYVCGTCGRVELFLAP